MSTPDQTHYRTEANHNQHCTVQYNQQVALFKFQTPLEETARRVLQARLVNTPSSSHQQCLT